MPTTRKPNKKSASDYEKLGRQIEETYLSGALDRKRLIFNSFIKGVSAGFGSIIGATIVIALLLWLLSAAGEIPFIGPISESVESTIKSSE